MLTAIFITALIYVSVRMLVWGIKATWGIAKIVAFVVLLPMLLVGLAMVGLFAVAFCLLILLVLISSVATILGF